MRALGNNQLSVEIEFTCKSTSPEHVLCDFLFRRHICEVCVEMVLCCRDCLAYRN